MGRILLAGLICLTLTSCYHATVETGMPAGGTTVEEKWAASWIGGLVPPDEVDVSEQCRRGVARVETEHSFLNQLVAALTSGIFTPMHITVTCAARPSDDDAPETAGSPDEARRILERDGVVYLELDG